MKPQLTLQEKLRDLRDERGLTLSMLAGKTGIPLSTLQRTEGKKDMRVRHFWHFCGRFSFGSGFIATYSETFAVEGFQ